MKLKKLLFAVFCFCVAFVSMAQEKPQMKAVPAQLQYKLVVYENQDGGIIFNESVGNKRSIVGDMWKYIRQQYSSTISGQIAATSADILASSVGLLVEKMRSHKNDWRQQVMRDCNFTKRIPMSQEIANFYAATSNMGACDPQNMLFNGFGCQQYFEVDTIINGQKVKKSILGLDMKCSLRTDSLGMIRMLHHGKFEVVLDYFYFNPSICSLPNDSLSVKDMDLRTTFDFQRRKNLQFEVTAEVTSSWMNEAIQIVEDQKLGEFKIKVCIPDNQQIEKGGKFEGCYVYVRPDSALMCRYGWDWNDKEMVRGMQNKNVSVTGESFLVPRSFIGTEDGKGYKRVWGTGQYKINMNLAMKCDINMPFYYDDSKERSKQINENRMLQAVSDDRSNAGIDNTRHHWNNYWSEEWNKIKKRRKSKGFFASIWNNINLKSARKSSKKT